MAEGFSHNGSAALVRMANDIGRFWDGEPEREDAVAGIINHISKFWTQRMRSKLQAYLAAAGDSDLDDLPREALKRLEIV